MSCGFRSLGAQFMTAVPAFRALRMSPAEFSVAVRHHFGERQPVVTGVAVCGCGAAMGERGDGAHYLECRGGRTGNWFARFHDAIERQVARMMGEVYLGRGTVRTQDYTGHHHYSRSHIPDITVADYDGRGSTLVVEVSVFRPTCGAHLPVAAGDPPGGASRDVERRRRADYGALAPGVRWRPFVLDTWGHLGPGTVRFLEELAEERGGRRRRRGAWATVEGAYGGDDAEDPTISWLAGWRQRISVVVARQAAQTISRRAVADLADQWGAAAMAV